MFVSENPLHDIIFSQRLKIGIGFGIRNTKNELYQTICADVFLRKVAIHFEKY